MARPTQSGGNEKRELIIPVRVTATEKNNIEGLAKASGIKYLSDFMRKKIFDGDNVKSGLSLVRDTLIRLLAHLGKIGSNVNQIAKVINQRQLSGEKIDISAERIQATLDNIDNLTKYLLEILKKNVCKRNGTW